MYRLLPFLLALLAQYFAVYGAPKSFTPPPPPPTTTSQESMVEGGPHADPNGMP